MNGPYSKETLTGLNFQYLESRFIPKKEEATATSTCKKPRKPLYDPTLSRALYILDRSIRTREIRAPEQPEKLEQPEPQDKAYDLEELLQEIQAIDASDEKIKFDIYKRELVKLTLKIEEKDLYGDLSYEYLVSLRDQCSFAKLPIAFKFAQLAFARDEFTTEDGEKLVELFHYAKVSDPLNFVELLTTNGVYMHAFNSAIYQYMLKQFDKETIESMTLAESYSRYITTYTNILLIDDERVAKKTPKLTDNELKILATSCRSKDQVLSGNCINGTSSVVILAELLAHGKKRFMDPNWSGKDLSAQERGALGLYYIISAGVHHNTKLNLLPEVLDFVLATAVAGIDDHCDMTVERRLALCFDSLDTLVRLNIQSYRKNPKTDPTLSRNHFLIWACAVLAVPMYADIIDKQQKFDNYAQRLGYVIRMAAPYEFPDIELKMEAILDPNGPDSSVIFWNHIRKLGARYSDEDLETVEFYLRSELNLV